MLDTFIRATDDYTTAERAIAAPYLRRSFMLPFAPTQATLHIATPGFYELYVNGQRVTKGYLAPYIANPDDLIVYDTYELAPYLHEGRNAIGILLGNGFANQTYEQWNFSKATFRAPLCVAVDFFATNGKENVAFSSDDSFKVHPSHVVYDMYRFGTHIDTRAYIDGWCEADFDDSGWASARITTPPRGEKTPCTAHPITLAEELVPKSVREVHDTCYLRTAFRGGEDIPSTRVEHAFLYDFGVSRAGVCRLRIRGERGQRITLRHGERLTDDGTFTFNSIYTFKDDYDKYIHLYQTDVFILKGGEEEILVPPFTYHGFRYVLVEGITEPQATRELLTFEVVHSAIPQRASFTCSDEQLNTLVRMGLAADTSNFHYFPTDCPHREKNGWTGDIAVSAEQYQLFFACTDSLTLWLRSLAKAQRPSGELPGICPTTGWGFAWGNGPFWDLACVEVPYHAYKYHGTREPARVSADMIARYLHYIASRRDERGLVAIGLPDWVQVEYKRGGIRAPLVLTDSATVYDMAGKAAILFRLLGRESDGAFAEQLRCDMLCAIRTHLIDYGTMCAAGRCQTSQAYLLSLGIFCEDEYERAYRTLLSIIHEDGDRCLCGVIGLRHIFEVLVCGGDVDLALHMITRPDVPSYGAMIARGATALCEALDENGVQESENHHFLGDILRVFHAHIAGLRINPTVTDHRTLLFSPTPPRTLTHAEASYIFDSGTATGGFRRKGEQTVAYVTVPSGVRGSFVYRERCEELHEGYNEFIIG